MKTIMMMNSSILGRIIHRLTNSPSCRCRVQRRKNRQEQDVQHHRIRSSPERLCVIVVHRCLSMDCCCRCCCCCRYRFCCCYRLCCCSPFVGQVAASSLSRRYRAPLLSLLLLLLLLFSKTTDKTTPAVVRQSFSLSTVSSVFPLFPDRHTHTHTHTHKQNTRGSTNTPIHTRGERALFSRRCSFSCLMGYVYVGHDPRWFNFAMRQKAFPSWNLRVSQYQRPNRGCRCFVRPVMEAKQNQQQQNCGLGSSTPDTPAIWPPAV